MNRAILRHACGVLVATLAGGLAPVASRAAETEVYLSWGSPHGAPGARDTLPGYWSFRSGSRGPGSCWGEFGVSSMAGCPFPFPEGYNLSGATFSRRDGKGFLRVGYAVSAKKPGTVRAGTHYCLARVLFQHGGKGSPGCDQPLRVTWSEAVFHLDRGNERLVLSGRGHPVYLRTR